MHFIGMLAFIMPMPVGYDLGLTLLSLVVAIGVTGFGFFMIGTRQVTALEFVLSGIFMGIGIVAMHYIGMAAMRMAADIRYDRVLVALSVLIAIGASIPALWLAFRTTLAWQRLLAAVVMGSAISGMHYTGMAAATFIAYPGMDGTRREFVLAQTACRTGNGSPARKRRTASEALSRDSSSSPRSRGGRKNRTGQ
jgi:NO-binding membrane sensor protein with MHYT domain